jgi:trans-aconitate methyltransferase
MPNRKGRPRPLRLNDERIASVVAVLKAAGAKRVFDLGCGEGHLIQALLEGSP